jgi:hypothetical protein
MAYSYSLDITAFLFTQIKESNPVNIPSDHYQHVELFLHGQDFNIFSQT